MEKKSVRPLSPFDERTVPGPLHTLKLFLPYAPVSSRRLLGILIRVMELHYTMQYYRSEIPSPQNQDAASSPFHMLEELSPYFSSQEADLLHTFQNMMHIMEMVQMMQEFSDSGDTAESGESGSDTAAKSGGAGLQGFDLQTLMNLFASGFAGSSGSSGSAGQNPVDLLMGMLSPEQRETFEMYQEMFSSTDETEPPNTKKNPDSGETPKVPHPYPTPEEPDSYRFPENPDSYESPDDPGAYQFLEDPDSYSSPDSPT